MGISAGMAPRVLSGVLVGFLVLFLCSCNSDSDKVQYSYETDFTTALDGSGNPNFPSPDTPPAPGAGGGPERDPEQDDIPEDGDLPREIQEADVVQQVGPYLYALSRHRGLVVVDLSDGGLRAVARRSLNDAPEEMIVRDDRAFVVVNTSSPYLCQPIPFLPAASVGFTGSRIEILDISAPEAPTSIASYGLNGSIRDTRLVGDAFYVVTDIFRFDPGTGDARRTTEVSSFLLRDGGTVEPVDTVSFPTHGWDTTSHFTDRALYVARSRYSPDDEAYLTRIRYVDISDPDGALRLRDEFLAPGVVQDRWQLDEDGDVFRVVSQETRGNSRPWVFTFDVSDPDDVRQRAGMEIELPRDEQITAARFDGHRCYVVTFERIDPLFVIDLSDPDHPVQRGELEMTGWLDHIETRGDRLIALGHEQVGNRLELAVSLLDVSNPDAPALLARETFGAGWISEDRDDFGKVFRVLDDLGLILVPFQSISRSGRRYLSEGRVQLLDFDLDTDHLAARGFARHGDGIRRAIPVDGDVLAVSDTEIRRLDISDRDNPLTIGRLDIARNTVDVAWLPGLTVELCTNYFTGSRLVIQSGDEPDRMEAVTTVSLDIDFARRVFADPATARVHVSGGRYLEGTYQFLNHVQTVELRDPARPVVHPAVSLEVSAYGTYNSIGSTYVDIEGETVFPIGGSTLVTQSGTDFVVADLRAPESPTITRVPVEGADRVHHPVVRDRELLFSYYDRSTAEWNPTIGRFEARYWLGRLDLTNPSEPVFRTPINIPGILVDLDRDGHHATTIDSTAVDGVRAPRSSLCAIDLIGDQAFLLDRLEIPTTYYLQLRADERRVILLSHSYSGPVNRTRLTSINRSSRTRLLQEWERGSSSFGSLDQLAEGRALLWSYPDSLAIDVRSGRTPGETEVRTLPFTGRPVQGPRGTYLLGGYRGVRRLDEVLD